MALTRDFILQQLEQLERRHAQLIAEANTVNGALQSFRVTLAEVDKPEQLAPKRRGPRRKRAVAPAEPTTEPEPDPE